MRFLEVKQARCCPRAKKAGASLGAVALLPLRHIEGHAPHAPEGESTAKHFELSPGTTRRATAASEKEASGGS